MKLYKIRHIPTGKYWDPHKYGGSDWLNKKLSKTGKWFDRLPIIKNSIDAGLWQGVTKLEDWEIEVFEVTSKKTTQQPSRLLK